MAEKKIELSLGDYFYTVDDIPKKMAQDVLNMQSAPNLVALVNSWQRMNEELLKMKDHNTAWVRFHPVTVMVLNQLVFLCHGTFDHQQMSKIWELVEQAAKKTA
jgi:hypothetical protein